MMNETEPFAPSVPAGQTSFMTTREVAETLEVGLATIQRAAKKLFTPSSVQTRVINGGKSMIFNAEQVTAIKEELMRHHNIRSEMPEKMQTELSIMHRVADGFAALKEWNTSLQQQLSEEKRKNEEMRPKAEKFDRLASFTDRKGDAAKAVSFTKAAERLGILRSDFIALIVGKRLVTRRALPGRGYYYKPAAKYKALFIRKPHTRESSTSSQLFVTEAGIEFFTELLKS